MPHWVQITSGRGPTECSWVAFRVFQEILKQAMEHGLTVDVLEMVPDTPLETCKSALLVLDNDEAGDFSGSWEGVIQWIGTSPFRPNHKRKNWFVGVRVFSPPPSVSFSEKDIRIQTMKASGPGGQHVNKTESAVRITHLPTNLTATAREERSQHLNRKLAMARLAELIKEHDQDRHGKTRQEMWDAHNSLERGNPVRIFEGARFKKKK